ncbi:MAG TPA: ABC transporter substrate-binding protein [Stellaceae bacterium]|nr:ABC transporter substrate-binding protein [Stellaceae bacterium]
MNRMLVSALAVAGIFALSTAASADPVKIRVGWVAAPGELPSIMAFKKDVAKHWDKSYSFEAIHFQGTPPMMTAMASNQVDLTPLSYSTLGLGIINAGMSDLTIVADEIRDGVPGWRTNEFMVLKDSPIKTVADLKGKTLATNAIGAGIDLDMEYMLFKNHMTRPRDYNVVEAAFGNMPSLLLEHKVDLITAINPFAQNPQLRAAARDLYTMRDAVGGETELAFWTGRGAFLKANRAAVVDFFEDYLRIMRWYLDPANRTEMLKIVSDFMKLPVQALDATTFNHQDFYRDPNAMPNMKALQANVDMAQTMGIVKQHIDVAKVTDLSYIEAAAKRLQ